MPAQGMVIPTAPVDYSEKSAESLSSIKDSNWSIENILKSIAQGIGETVVEQNKVVDSIKDQQKKQEDLAGGGRIGNLKKKLTTYWGKLMKKKWFEKTLTVLQNLGARGGGFLVDILKFLLFIAFFGGKGLLKTITKLLITISLTIFTVLLKLIPEVIDLIGYAITMISRELTKAIPAFMKVLADLFGKLKQKAPEPLKSLFSFLEYLVTPQVSGELSLLGKLIKLITSNLGYLVAAFVALVVITKLATLATTISSAATVIWTVLTWLWNAAALVAQIAMGGLIVAAWLLTTPVGLVVIGVLLLIGAFYLLYKYSDKIVGFFESLWSRFKNLSSTGQMLVRVLAVVLAPLTLFVAMIYGLAKLFQSFKKIGVVETFQLIYTSITDFLTELKYVGKVFEILLDFFEETFSILKHVWKGDIGFADALIYIQNAFFEAITALWNLAKKVLPKLFGRIIGGILNFLGELKDEFLDTLGNVFSGSALVQKIKNSLKNLFGTKTFSGLASGVSRALNDAASGFKHRIEKLLLWMSGMFRYMSQFMTAGGIARFAAGEGITVKAGVALSRIERATGIENISRERIQRAAQMGERATAEDKALLAQLEAQGIRREQLNTLKGITSALEKLKPSKMRRIRKIPRSG